ncbi:retrovirus-related Pol polyprotein from transposon TNT 1-94 [Trifolium medium]|uniref:Retrovirus-related Pol polyprotein from transposon TNT 1-94 n=1 Tax=Trifolium medium TaxID=97028 RepID=A0A392M524_9FABA|nr:retrovirus-related Pol polyprotein from transposon TNT 1-94 [Trifolium medium]
MDIWGPLSIPSMLGYKYFLTIVDDKSRFTWLYLMKLKSETSALIQSFHAMIKTQFNANIKCIRSDNGKEFLLKDFYAANGIVHQSSCVSTPQQNGIVERKHQHILGTARALLFQSHLPKLFWAHAVGHAVHIINRLPTPFLSNKSPFQILFNQLPDISTLKVFGSLAYAATLQSHRQKLDSRSRKCVTLGFQAGVKGHILFDLKSKEIFLSRDVVFFEYIFPYASSTNNSGNQSSSNASHHSIIFDDIDFTPSPESSSIPSFDHHDCSSSSQQPSLTPSSIPTSHDLSNPNTQINSSPHTNTSSQTQSTNDISNNPSLSPSFHTPPINKSLHNNNPVTNPIRKSNRISHPPSYLQDYHHSIKNHTVNCVSQLPPSSSQCKYPLSSFISYNHISSAQKHYALNISTLSEPSTYEEAMHNEHWKNAINVELSALLKNHTWDLVKLPSHKKAIGCKWVFKLKLHADGTVERHKARLVAKGFTQTEGIDYIDTFSPVVKMTTVRTFMAIAASQNWPLYQLDVNTAFLHGDLHEEVYMKPPPGLQLSSPDLVCKLQRSLYGLKQASRQWNAKLTETLIFHGYTQSKADYSLFTKKSSVGFTAILVYVDDLVLGGTDMNEITQLKSLLDTKFSIKDLGNLNLLATKPCPTPMQPHLQLHKSSGHPLSEPTTYRRLIGGLLYLTHSRPEIAYAVSKLSQFLDSPTDAHMLAGLHVLKYLKNNPGQGLFFSSSSSLQLKGYSDSDWGHVLIQEGLPQVFASSLAPH